MDVTRLTYMANQIALNLTAQGEAEAIAATTQHIRDFWDPRMKAAILADSGEELNPIARQAVEALRG
jgi:formate dehydrogenase subunit delta